jgi:hypothetical protein
VYQQTLFVIVVICLDKQNRLAVDIERSVGFPMFALEMCVPGV